MNKIVMRIIICLAVLPIIVVAIYNLVKNENFWDASFTTCVSLLIATALSFYFVQRQTDHRRQKELFLKLMESLKVLVDDEKSYKFCGVSREEILMRKRDMSNKISFIEKYSKKFHIGNDIKFLKEKFNEYDMVIGNHIDDLETLSKLNNELSRPLSLMSQKIFEIMLNLFN